MYIKYNIYTHLWFYIIFQIINILSNKKLFCLFLFELLLFAFYFLQHFHLNNNEKKPTDNIASILYRV